MATSQTTTINFSSTSLSGTTGATTPATFTATAIQPDFTVAAILTEASTTITGYQVEGTTGLAVVDGTTLTWRHEGITLANGVVVSLGFNGLEDKTTTAFYEPVSVSSGATVPTVSGTASTTTHSLTMIKGTHTTGGSGTPTTGGSGATGTGSAASSQSSGVAPTLGAGKAVALLGALGGIFAFGL